MLRPWQKRFIRAVYATTSTVSAWFVRRAEHGARNGNNSLAAMLALCHLAGPETESRGEVYSAANDRDQAGRIFKEMAAIIERVPWLGKRVSIKRFTKELEDVGAGGTGSTYAALSRESGTKMGLAASVVIYDELGQSESRDLLDALDTAMGKKAEPLMIVISTQAARDEAPLSSAHRLRSSVSSAARLSIRRFTSRCTVLLRMQIRGQTWKLAIRVGDFRSLEDVRRLALQAQRIPFRRNELSKSDLESASRCHFAVHRCAILELCAARATSFPQVSKGAHVSQVWTLAPLKDMTALVLAFAGDNGEYIALPHCWLPSETLQEAEDSDGMPYAGVGATEITC